MDFPPMPLLPISSPATIAACKALPLRPSDVFICSYPKSGTTWTQHIVLTLLLAEKRYAAQASNNSVDGDDSQLNYNHVSEYAPFFEIDAHWDHAHNCLVKSVRENHDRLNQRVFNTHLRWEMLPKSCQNNNNNNVNSKDGDDTSKRPSCGKFIYITRNLLDVCTSFYHHLSNQKEGTYEHDYTTFATDWMNGSIAFGSALYHLLSFAEGFADNRYADDDTSGQPLLLLSYERMKCNLRKEVLRIMEFLNLTHIPMEELDTMILPSFEFEAMKSNIDRFQPKSVTWLNGFTFLRRGESGDGKVMMNTTIDGKESLLGEYDQWIQREGYKDKIGMLLNCETADEKKMKEVRNVFSGVVDHS